MARINIKQEIQVYEVNDVEVPIGKEVTIRVDSHWNRDELVVLGIGRKRYTVVSEDLVTAIHNAENSGGI